MKQIAIKAALCLTTIIAAASPALADFKERTFRVSNGINEDHPVNTGMKAMQVCLDEKPPVYLKGGEVMRLGIEGLGEQTQNVIRA